LTRWYAGELGEREAIMSGIEVVAAMGILFAFTIGIVIGVALIISIASRREDHLFSLWGEAPDVACRGARRLVGLWVRGGRPDEEFPRPAEDDGALSRRLRR
jgi:hypothetical protein